MSFNADLLDMKEITNISQCQLHLTVIFFINV